MIECGLYIHIPFCEKRCAYCSFFSSIIDETVKNKYIEEILNEITLLGKKNKNLKIKTIYIGGGTPSLLTLYDMELIFDKINSFFILDNPEITIVSALKATRMMLKRYKRRYLYMQLSFLGLLLLNVLSFGIGIFWTEPYMTQTTTLFYLDTKGELDSVQTERRKIHTPEPEMYNQYI